MNSLLSAPLPETVDLRQPDDVLDAFGSTLIVAPHPDDESLGCGGLIALLRECGLPVHILVVTDGTGSHPNSATYPPSRLQALREREATRAAHHLGAAPESLTFLRLRDRAVPTSGEAAFRDAAQRIGSFLNDHAFQTVVLPWHGDPHSDHQASWHLMRSALEAAPRSPRCLEYPVWAWKQPATLLNGAASRSWRLDIGSVLPQKKQAIGAHRSQLTSLIKDDPAGFCLPPAMRARFERPWELYIESVISEKVPD